MKDDVKTKAATTKEESDRNLFGLFNILFKVHLRMIKEKKEMNNETNQSQGK